MGVGIDLLEIDRMEQALERRPRLADRLFTDAERTEAARRGRGGAQFLAGRFCAKEAVLKALAGDVMRPREIEILPADDGPPQVLLHGATAEHARSAGVGRVELSITHSRTMAGAVAVTVPA